MSKFLDKTGFAYFWNIIKSELAKKADANHSHSASDIIGAKPIQKNITLFSSGWVDNQQTASVDGMTADCVVFTGSDIGNNQEYADCEVWCSAQGDGTLTFSCTYVPSEDLVVNVVIFI